MQIDIRFLKSSTFVDWNKSLNYGRVLTNRQDSIFRDILILWSDGNNHLRINKGDDVDLSWLVATAVTGMLISW